MNIRSWLSRIVLALVLLLLPLVAAPAVQAAPSAVPAIAAEDPPGYDPTWLGSLVLGILYAGTVGSGVYWLMENIEQIQGLDPRVKRLAIAPALSLILTLPLLLFAVWMGWIQQPATPQAWVNLVATLSLGAYFVSQSEHGALKLPKQRQYIAKSPM